MISILLFILSVLGLLVSVFIFFQKKQVRINRSFSFYIGVSSLMILSAFLVISEPQLFDKKILDLAALLFYPLAIFTPVAFYDFTCSVSLQEPTSNGIQKFFSIGYIVLLINLLSFIYLSNSRNESGDIFTIVESVMTYTNFIVILFIFPAVTILFIYKSTILIFVKQEVSVISKELIVNNLIAFTLLLSSFLINMMIGKGYIENVFYLFIVYFYISVLYTAYRILKLSSNAKLNEEEVLEGDEFTYFSQIEGSLLPTIEKQKLYLNTKLTLKECAKSIGTNEKYLSNYLNKNHKVNFNTFINNYRIEAAKDMLLSDDSDKYTIEAIAQMSGFNSKSSFNSVFKKHTGYTPSEYRNENKN